MTTTEIDFHPLIHTVLDHLSFTSCIHGPDHWGRVLENGLRLAPMTGADPEVVALFAILHDSCRNNDKGDIFHGPRAVRWMATLDLGRFLNPDQIRLLGKAIGGHTNRLSTSDPTVATCWDADRLDIGRIGTTVDPFFLSTRAAQDPEILEWAQDRASNVVVPDFVIPYL